MGNRLFVGNLSFNFLRIQFVRDIEEIASSEMFSSRYIKSTDRALLYSDYFNISKCTELIYISQFLKFFNVAQ